MGLRDILRRKTARDLATITGESAETAHLINRIQDPNAQHYADASQAKEVLTTARAVTRERSETNAHYPDQRFTRPKKRMRFFGVKMSNNRKG